MPSWAFVITRGIENVKLQIQVIKTYLFYYQDYKHSFERFYHEEFTEKCKQMFVISKESDRTFEILEKFALKDVELDFNNVAAGSSLDSVPR